MRIIFANTSGPTGIGGIERSIGELASRFEAMGHEVGYWGSDGASDDKGPPAEAIVPAFDPLGDDLSFSRYLAGLADAAARLRPYDLMIARHPHFAYAALTAHSDRPVLYYPPTVYPRYLAFQRDPSWASGLGATPTLPHRLAREAAVERSVLAAAAVTVMVSEARRREFAQSYGLAEKDLPAVPHGVDGERFGPEGPMADLGLPSDVPVVLTVSRLVPEKGLDLLLEAVSRCGVEDAHVVMLGSGPWRGRLERLAREMGVEERVRFWGAAQDPAPFYRAATVFAFPSVYEGFGIALLEAMASGSACLAFSPDAPRRCIATSELIDSGKSGLLVDGTVDALAEGLGTLLTDPSLRERVGVAAAARARAFDWDATAGALLDLARGNQNRPLPAREPSGSAPSDLDDRFDRVRDALEEGTVSAEHLASAQAIVADAPLWPEAQALLARAALALGDVGSALAAASTAVEVGSDQHRFWHLSAVVSMAAGRSDEALTSARHAYDLAPDNAQVGLDLAIAEAWTGATADAAGRIEELVASGHSELIASALAERQRAIVATRAEGAKTQAELERYVEAARAEGAKTQAELERYVEALKEQLEQALRAHREAVGGSGGG